MDAFSTQTDTPRTKPRGGVQPVPPSAKSDLPSVFGQAIEYESGAREIAHTHARAQLLYATSGLIRVRTPAASWVVTPDCAMLVPPRVEHELEMVGKVGFRTLYVDPCPAIGGDEGRLLPVNGLLREAILAMVEEPARTREPGSLADILTQLIVNLLAAASPADDQPGRLPLPQHPRLHRICQALIELRVDAWRVAQRLIDRGRALLIHLLARDDRNRLRHAHDRRVGLGARHGAFGDDARSRAPRRLALRVDVHRRQRAFRRRRLGRFRRLSRLRRSGVLSVLNAAGVISGLCVCDDRECQRHPQQCTPHRRKLRGQPVQPRHLVVFTSLHRRITN